MPDPREQIGPLLGAVLELEIGAVAQGGACVARHEGRVVFVRHTLPGERVRARVTEDRGGAFCRADAVEILSASPDRVEAPCPFAGPGRCGGCDWQHASGEAQRAGKAAVVRDLFSRLGGPGGIDVAPLLTGVEELAGGLLGWRTRVLYAVDRAGRPGLHRHHARELEHVDRCLLGVPGVGDSPVLSDAPPVPLAGLTGVEVARGDDGEIAVLAHRPGGGRQARGRRPPDRVRVVSGPDTLHREVDDVTFGVAAGGFWQVHPLAARTFAGALLDAVVPRPGESVLDLYAGAGALTASLAHAVGADGDVLGIESDARAVADAQANLSATPWAQVVRGRVDAVSLAGLDGRPDLVVLDPPRAGVGAPTMRALLALGPRAVGYVSCDPATLARDVAAATELGWRLASLRAFDAYPMTHHVECVALLLPPEPAV